MFSKQASNTILLFLLTIVSTTVSAKTFLVDSTVDQLDSNISDGECATTDHTCTLRAAIQQANEFPGPDVIKLPAGMYLLNIDTTALARSEEKALKGDLDILDELVIEGLGASPNQSPEPQTDVMTVIDGANIDRVFDVHTNKTVQLKNIAIQNGLVVSGFGAGLQIAPSTSIVDTQIIINDVLFRNNNCSTGNGGAIRTNRGVELTVDSSVFHDNSAHSGGAIYISTSSSNVSIISNSVFYNNTATLTGGAIESTIGNLSIINSNFDKNTAINGGGLYADNVILVNSQFTNNVATLPTNPTNSRGGGAMLTTSGAKYIHNTIFENNTADGYGGGLVLLSIADTIANNIQLTNNHAGLGGGGLYTSGIIDISDTSIVGNTTDGDGAGLFIFKSTTSINQSAITNNQALNNLTTASRGGGIYVNGGATLRATALTLSDNKVLTNTNNSGQGGGLYLDTYIIPAASVAWSNAMITHGSIVLNEADNGGNIAANIDNQGTIQLQNSILQAAPSRTNCGLEFSSNLTILTVSANIASDNTCGVASSNWTIADSGINTVLALNGGTTPNHALLSNSAAINASQSTLCDPLDQRYYERDVADGMCDIGATEFASSRINAGTLNFARDLSIGENYLVSELTPSVSLNVIRSQGATGDVSVQYRTRAASAKEGTDYSAKSGTLNFTGNITSMPITISPRNDTIFELDEKFYVELYNPQKGVAIGTVNAAEIQIQDGGNRPPSAGSFSFATTTQTVAESNTRHMIKVQRTSGSDLDVSVDYELITTGFISGTRATLGGDFLLSNGTLNFPHGVTEQAFFIELIDDNVYEGDKKVEIRLVNALGGGDISLGSSSKFTLTIDDDEPRPPLAEFITSLPIEINEGDPANESLLRFLIFSGETLDPVSVDYKVTGGSATLGVDYKLASGTVYYNPADPLSQNLFSIPITIIDDQEVEPIETIIVELTNLQGNIQLGKNTTALIRITDNDKNPPAYGKLAFEQAQYSVDEVAQTYNIKVIRNNGTDGMVSVNYNVIGGNAITGEDFIISGNTLTFNSGETVKEIPVEIIDDLIEEGAETIQLELSSNTGGATIGLAQTTLTINASDIPPPPQGELSFEQLQYSTDEINTTLTVNVVRNNGSTGLVTVDYKVVGGSATQSADFLLNDGTLTFNDAEISKSIVLTIIDDNEFEPRENILLKLSNSQGGAIIGLSTTTVFITANDERPSTVKFLSDRMTVLESEFSHKIDVVREGTAPATVTINYAVTGGTASDGPFPDYNIFSNSLTFGAGETSKTIDLTILDDFDIEENETIELTLINSNNPEQIGTPATITITIVDDDSTRSDGGGGGGTVNLFELIFLGLLLILSLNGLRKESGHTRYTLSRSNLDEV